MIIEFFVNIVVTLLCGAVSGLKLLSLPVDMIGALATVIQYGSYVMGADLFLLVMGSVMFFIDTLNILGKYICMVYGCTVDCTDREKLWR